ncbi:hypothetical protein [Paenibacillus sp. NEAU-GSW1]|uniref:hypothetical protein n=1 Tax=Paenibacillus sp. NEAU-GSW1 TaxID=2682486 RepID=UPI0012E2E65A|nr:hypothetical protein [Paenibacillus sp. NEAU-GSW1]MUT65485.1 hypothetical protein [Paenibacillus sp. NEAU-GSW1]
MKMRIAKPYLTGLLAALAVTLLLAWLPHANHFQPGGEVAVFHPSPATRLSNSNLVDSMVGLQLASPLAKVVWNHAILSVDIKVSDNPGQARQWPDDMRKLFQLSFVQMDNVNRVLIRFVDDSQDQAKLLFAVDVRRGDSWLAGGIEELGKADPLHNEMWRQRLRISFTSAWEERFGRADGYSAVPMSERAQ